MFTWLKNTIDRCLTQKEANTRLVFLLGGAVGAVCALSLTVGFILDDPVGKAHYPAMLTALGLFIGASYAGRWATKHAGSPKNDA